MEIRQYQSNCDEVSKFVRSDQFSLLDLFFFYAWGKKHMNTNKVSISDYTFNFVPVVPKRLVSL